MVEAVANRTHISTDPEFLSFNEDDILIITDMEVKIDDTMSWYTAYLNGNHGSVCSSMLDITPYNWYWAGSVSCLMAESNLLNSKTHQFLIRQTNGKFYLSYKSKIHDDKVWHFLIHYHIGQDINFSFFTDWNGKKKEFGSLTELANYVKMYGSHSCILWSPAPDEEDLQYMRSRRRKRWPPNK